MTRPQYLLVPTCLVAFLTGCSQPAPEQKAQTAPPESTAPRLYVTNEVSGDLTIIDSGTYNVIATVPLGKRPRGIHASPDRKTIYIAVSGSPIAGPGVDESTLPPAGQERRWNPRLRCGDEQSHPHHSWRFRSGKFRPQPRWRPVVYFERRRCRGKRGRSRIGHRSQVGQGWRTTGRASRLLRMASWCT